MRNGIFSQLHDLLNVRIHCRCNCEVADRNDTTSMTHSYVTYGNRACMVCKPPHTLSQQTARGLSTCMAKNHYYFPALMILFLWRRRTRVGTEGRPSHASLLLNSFRNSAILLLFTLLPRKRERGCRRPPNLAKYNYRLPPLETPL